MKLRKTTKNTAIWFWSVISQSDLAYTDSEIKFITEKNGVNSMSNTMKTWRVELSTIKGILIVVKIKNIYQ